ncbi:c-type cytochrome [Enhygromyxa salina]|uniref:Cytochrome c6 n=1 Tax=Enhygromyxa salina TaxID=215803 RepID=A0A2S9YJ16_9BACT|nr:c-type cytochrome [Enhygromyxa salina]PRQ05050.1 Cytochrome c6 [Enhygromyxa salina]
MHRLAIRSLVLAATALLLTTAACDSGEPKADGAKKADGAAEPAKADDGAAEADKADGAAEAGVAAEAGAAGTEPAEATGADAADETDDGGGDETGEAAPAAGEEGGDAPPPADDKPVEKKPAADKAPAVAKIDGKPLFESKCKSCHGIDGAGDTTIGKKVEIPSLVKTKLGQAKIVSTITNGVPDTKMKGYKDKLSKEQIDAVAAYVKKL